MKSHPVQLLTKSLLDALEFYFPALQDLVLKQTRPVSVSARMERLAVSFFHLALWALAFVGIWKMKEKKVRISQLLILLGIVALCLPYFPVIAYIGHAQYAAPLVPLLAILAAIGLSVWQKLCES
jgi:hypothetical protein